MLTGFDKALLDFERDAYSLLHECHFNAGEQLSNFNVQIQAQSLATDLGYFAIVMRDLHQNAIRYVSNEVDREINKHLQKRNVSMPLAKLGSAFKAFLFLVRAYQDAIYKIALCIDDQAVGGKSSMTKAVDVKAGTFIDSNSVGKLLASTVPEYATWFSGMRKQRDFIKYGAGIGYISAKNFVTGETAVAIKLHTSSELEQPTISLDDVSCALRMSTAATKAIINFGVTRGKFHPRATKDAL